MKSRTLATIAGLGRRERAIAKPIMSTIEDYASRISAPAAATSGRQMRICRRCKAEKETDQGPFCGSCARRFAAIKRGAHAFGCVSRGDRKRCTSKVTLPSLWMAS